MSKHIIAKSKTPKGDSSLRRYGRNRMKEGGFYIYMVEKGVDLVTRRPEVPAVDLKCSCQSSTK